MTEEKLKQLPKVELHCHLDGSLSRAFVEKQLGQRIEEEQLQVSEECNSLEEYLGKFTLPLACIQDAKGLREAGYDFLRSMAEENVIYTEVRFAPGSSVQEGFSEKQVIEALLEGLKQGKRDFGVEYNVIVCAMRHYSEEANLRMLKAARLFLGEGVCAADLAGSEAMYPMAEFKGLFSEAKRMGFPFTIHAGETGNAQNIVDAVEVGASRIGHGIAMRGQKPVKELCREKRIGIEMCPISNLQTKAVQKKEDYPMKEFLDAGLLVTVNTDNRTVSNTSLTKELAFLQKEYGISDEEIRQMIRNAVEVSFASEEIKAMLYQRIR